MCICKGKGKTAQQIARRAIAQIKKVHGDPEGRDLVKNSCLVLQLSGGPKAGSSLDRASEGTTQFVTRWLHVGFTLCSPWKHYVMEVDVAPAPPGEPAANHERCYVAATKKVSSFYKALVPLVGCPEVRARFSCSRIPSDMLLQ